MADVLVDSRKIDAALLASVTRSSAAKLRQKIPVKIWLTDTSADALAKLKAAGFTATSSLAGGFILGECDASRLSDLAKLGFVRYISMP